MKSIVSGFLLAFLALPALAATSNSASGELSFPKASIIVEYKWLQGPDSKGESILQLSWMDEQTKAPIAPPAFNVAILMPSMPEMVNPPTQIAPLMDSQGKLVPGGYTVQKIFFTMGGEWNVNLAIGSGHSTETQSIVLQLDDPMCIHH